MDPGGAGVGVENAGGRKGEGGAAGITMLPAVVEAVARRGSCEVLVDGGARRGTDVLRAIALGARAVMVGRPILWGLTLDGADGVRAVLQRIRAEIDLSMALAGCATIADVTADLIMRE